jgi:hypothetical protein
VTRLSRGEADGADMAEAIEQLVSATVASLQAPGINEPVAVAKPVARRPPARAIAGRRKKVPV